MILVLFSAFEFDLIWWWQPNEQVNIEFGWFWLAHHMKHTANIKIFERIENAALYIIFVQKFSVRLRTKVKPSQVAESVDMHSLQLPI